MKKIIFIISALAFFACNPCKYVARHPECFQADTIRTSDNQQSSDSTYLAEKDSFRIVLKEIKDTSCKKDVELLLEQLSSKNGIISDLRIINSKDRAILEGKISRLVNKKKQVVTKKEFIKVLNPLNIELEEKLKKLEEKLKKADVKIKLRNRIINVLSVVLILIIAAGIILKKLKLI